MGIQKNITSDGKQRTTKKRNQMNSIKFIFCFVLVIWPCVNGYRTLSENKVKRTAPGHGGFLNQLLAADDVNILFKYLPHGMANMMRHKLDARAPGDFTPMSIYNS